MKPSTNFKHEQIFQSIVDKPFIDKVQAAKLGLGIVVLLLVNKKDSMIDRVALSRTEQAKGAVKVSVKPFKQIRIPLNTETNIIAKTIKTGSHHMTDDWRYLFNPALSAKEARLNQASAGIGCSCVYPLQAGSGGALIFSFFLPPGDINEEHQSFMRQYALDAAKQLQKISS